MTEHLPDSSKRPPNHAVVFSISRGGGGNPETAKSLQETALSNRFAGIVRATALDLLRPYATINSADQVASLLRDPDPIVRAAAIPIQRAATPAMRVQRLGPLLRDERRSVRIAAARALLDILADGPPPMLASFARQAIGEYQRSLTSKADFPEIQMAIAGTAMVFKKFRTAEWAFSEAVRMDPQRVNAWAMIARLRAAQDNVEGAISALRDGLEANPDDARLTRILRDLRRSDRRK